MTQNNKIIQNQIFSKWMTILSEIAVIFLTQILLRLHLKKCKVISFKKMNYFFTVKNNIKRRM